MKLYYSIAALLLITSCTDNVQTNDSATKDRSLQDIKWMLGNWQNVMTAGIISEEWKAVSDTLWTGQGKMMDTAGNTIFSEQLQLVLRNDTIWYVPTVANQNNGEDVWFIQTTLSDTSVVFENPTHDFPQRIVYHKISDSALYAYIEGMQNGKMRKEAFNYKRRQE